MTKNRTDEHVQFIVPPPLVYLIPLVIGILIDRAVKPVKIVSATRFSRAVGWATMLTGIGLLVWAVRTLMAVGEHPDPDKPTDAIVSTGPYAFSRNPIYLAFTLLYTGITLVMNTLWPIIYLPGVLALVHYGAVLPEERYLEARLGDAYRQYRMRTRRWL